MAARRVDSVSAEAADRLVWTTDDGTTERALVACAVEPIAIPGAVQPHGVLLAVTEPDLTVLVASTGAAGLLGAEVSGRSLTDLLGPADVLRLRAGLAGDLTELNPLRVQVGGAGFDLVVHRVDGLLVTEWEPVTGAEQADVAWHRRLPAVLQRLSGTAGLAQLTAVLADDVRSLTGFDRVMVYRFDADWNGEVLAESRRADLQPFLGLHYPASDIPAQARALYATNWQRLIPDAGYRPDPLVPDTNPLTGLPLDLSGSVLRSVSPMHLQYLANMDVVASMSVSLIDRGKLWGLIACHHYSGPHRPSFTDRTAVEFLARTASLLLPSKVEVGQAERVVDVAPRQAQLAAALGRSPRDPAAPARPWSATTRSGGFCPSRRSFSRVRDIGPGKWVCRSPPYCSTITTLSICRTSPSSNGKPSGTCTTCAPARRATRASCA